MGKKNANRPSTEAVEKTEEVVEVKNEIAEDAAETIEETKMPEVFKVKVVNCERLRIRKAPTTKEDNEIKVIDAGTILAVKEHSEKWFEVVDGGFVMSEFVARI